MNIIESKVHNLLNKKLNELGYEIISIKYLRENKEFYLKITVDRDGDISLDQIVSISDLISPLLDASDIIKDKYILDISSLGAEKEIKVEKLDKYVNSYLNIHLSNPYKGLNNLIGTLVAIDNTNATIEYKEKTRTIRAIVNRKYIDKAHLAIKF